MKNPKTLSAWFKRAGIHTIPRPRYTESHFDRHTKSIGSLLLAWNDLHERLSTLFVNAMGGNPAHFARSFALWHQTRTDYNKRQLLRAAVSNIPASEMQPRIVRADGSRSGARPKLVEEIIWILDNAKKLEDWRDDSAHTPLRYTYVGDVLSFEALLNDGSFVSSNELKQQIVVTQTGFANPRALRNSKKNILIEARYARERILVLRDYALAIDVAWTNPPLPWPDRPALPDRKPSRQSKGRAAHRRQK